MAVWVDEAPGLRSRVTTLAKHRPLYPDLSKDI